METVFTNAIENANQRYMSNEAIMTVEVEEEQKREEEQYLLKLKMSESGVNILDYHSIYKKFASTAQDIYVGINDEFYFNDWIDISSMSMTENSGKEQPVFSVSNNINAGDAIIVYASYDIDDSEGTTSRLEIKFKNDDTVINEVVVKFTNGSAIYDAEIGYYLPEIADEYDDSKIHEFISDMNSYIKEDMNSIKKEIDSLRSCIPTEELGPTVAGSACYSCGEEYISVNEDIYPYGKCINCGEENSLKECIRCYSIYNSDIEGVNELCDGCYDFVIKD